MLIPNKKNRFFSFVSANTIEYTLLLSSPLFGMYVLNEILTLQNFLLKVFFIFQILLFYLLHLITRRKKESFINLKNLSLRHRFYVEVCLFFSVCSLIGFGYSFLSKILTSFLAISFFSEIENLFLDLAPRIFIYWLGVLFLIFVFILIFYTFVFLLSQKTKKDERKKRVVLILVYFVLIVLIIKFSSGKFAERIMGREIEKIVSPIFVKSVILFLLGLPLRGYYNLLFGQPKIFY